MKYQNVSKSACNLYYYVVPSCICLLYVSSINKMFPLNCLVSLGNSLAATRRWLPKLNRVVTHQKVYFHTLQVHTKHRQQQILLFCFKHTGDSYIVRNSGYERIFAIFSLHALQRHYLQEKVPISHLNLSSTGNLNISCLFQC